MTMWNAEGREADAERDAKEYKEAEKRKRPIHVFTLEDFPDESHWAIMLFDRKKEPVQRNGAKERRVLYTAYLDESSFKESVQTLQLIGTIFKAFHVDAVAKISVEISIK